MRLSSGTTATAKVTIRTQAPITLVLPFLRQQTGKAKRPVALLPIGRRGYRLWDPADGSSVAVDDAIAAEIAPGGDGLPTDTAPHCQSGGAYRFRL